MKKPFKTQYFKKFFHTVRTSMKVGVLNNQP